MLCHERLRKVQDIFPDCSYRVDWAMLEIPRFLEQYGVDMDPDYQRGYVWDTEQKRSFVGAVIQANQTIPIFWFNWKGPSSGKSQVVDGKQRLNALLGWIEGKYDAVCPCGEVFHVDHLDEISSRSLRMMTTVRMHFVNLGRLDVLKFYLSLNAGGTVHTEKDLSKVRKLIKELEANA